MLVTYHETHVVLDSDYEQNEDLVFASTDCSSSQSTKTKCLHPISNCFLLTPPCCSSITYNTRFYVPNREGHHIV